MAIIVWSGTGLASLGSNWVGGIAPTNDDTARFSVAGGACTMDLSIVFEMDVDTLYTSVITQTVTLHVRTDFILVTNGTQNWITNGNDLNVDGNITVIGIGSGIVHNAGGAIRFGGNIDLDIGDYTSPTVIHHSLATPTAAKTHAVSNASGSKFVDLTVVDNQSIGGSISFWADNVAWGANINITGSGLLVANSAGTAWTGVANITWNGDSINSIALRWNQLTQFPVSDYGNIRLEYRSDTDFGVGTYQTTGLLSLGFNFGTSNLDMPSGCTFLLGDLDIGVAGSPTLGCVLTQKAGSSLQVTGDVIVRQDDTIEENKWVREAGVFNTLIGRDFIVEADAGIDFTNDTSTISVTTNIDISPQSSCEFGQSDLVHVGTGTVSNDSLTNKFAGFKIAAKPQFMPLLFQSWNRFMSIVLLADSDMKTEPVTSGPLMFMMSGPAGPANCMFQFTFVPKFPPLKFMSPKSTIAIDPVPTNVVFSALINCSSIKGSQLNSLPL